MTGFYGLKAFLWRIACALSNPVLMVEHAVFSPRHKRRRRSIWTLPMVNGQNRTQAYAMVSLCGKGWMFSYKQDEFGKFIRDASGNIERRSEFGDVAIITD